MNGSSMLDAALARLANLFPGIGWEGVLGSMMPSGAFCRFLAKHSGYFSEFSRLYKEWLAPAELKQEYTWIVESYSGAGRHYHTMLHIHYWMKACSMLEKTGEMPASEIALLRAGGFWHDAIFDLKRDDNEARSKEAHSSFCARHGIPGALAETVDGMILATDTRKEGPFTLLEMRARDIDKWNIGLSYRVFRKSFRLLEKELEYAGKDTGRQREFLATQYRREMIFETIPFEIPFGAKARRNIARLLGKKTPQAPRMALSRA